MSTSKNENNVEISRLSPFSSSPFVLSLDEFLMTENARSRPDLVQAIQAYLKNLTQIGLQAKFLLIGGSFIDRFDVARDVDGVCFYQIDLQDKEGNFKNLPSLFRVQEYGKESGIDMKLVPIDHDPLLMLRAAIYFSVLFSGDHRVPLIRRKDVWLVDLRLEDE